MAKAMGLNAITTYVFWNEHEPSPGVYDFTGNNDVAEFIREAQKEGLWVILRPGPYVCAEWEFGGYPAWLLKDPTTVIRSSDPKYMEPAVRWIKRLGRNWRRSDSATAAPSRWCRWRTSTARSATTTPTWRRYKQALLDAGFTRRMSTRRTAPASANGSLPELPADQLRGNHGNERRRRSRLLNIMRPVGPSCNSEFWAGWFDHWGEHATPPTPTGRRRT